MPSNDVVDGAQSAHTNGTTNGTANGTNGSKATSSKPIPVTKIFSDFIASATPSLLTPEIRTKVKEVIIDYLGVVASGSTTAPSSDPILKSILSLDTGHGSNTVITRGATFSPQYAALLNATFGHSLDFDDTYALGTLHAGVTSISTALACAESLAHSSTSSTSTTEDLILAIAIAYEITCRLGVELGYPAYQRGFHNTSTAGIFGSVAAICVLRHLPARVVEDAFGLAGSKAAGSMQYLENGSWNKRLHPGFASHDAFMCVALAENGVLGAEAIIEGKIGLLHAYSPNEEKDLNRLVTGLGSEWTWLASALKPYPACRMTHGFIELAGQIGRERGQGWRQVKWVKLYMSRNNWILVGQRTENKLHPVNIVDAQFSAYFQTSNARVHGASFDVAAYSRLEDAGIREMCDKCEVVVDDKMTGFSCRIECEFDDGKREDRMLQEPLGEVSHPFERELVEQKFRSLMVPVYGAEKTESVLECVYDLENRDVKELMGLVK